MRSSLEAGLRKGRLRGGGRRGNVLPEGSVSVSPMPPGKNLCTVRVS